MSQDSISEDPKLSMFTNRPSLPKHKIEFITRFIDAWKVFMMLYLSLEFF
jgi:hypothetical protein